MRMRRGTITRDPLLDWLYPELALCKDDAERRVVLKNAKEFGGPLSLGLFVAGMILTLIVGIPLLMSMRPYWMPREFVVMGWPIFLVSGVVVLALVGRSRRRRQMRRALIERGRMLCLACGYDLRGIDPSSSFARCPECGGSSDSM